MIAIFVPTLTMFACTPASIQIGGVDSDSEPIITDSPKESEPWKHSDDPWESIPGLPDTDTQEPEDTSVDPVDPAEEAKYQDFYDPTIMQEIRIELTQEAMRDLNRDGRTYVEGNVVVNGERFDSVGIRLKGSSTYQDLTGKAAFKIKLNEYVPGTRYATLERITLNNMLSDVSQSKEVIIYDALYQAGQIASRASFAQVYLNDELFGLYTNLESTDDHWLERRYEDATGNLWDTGSENADWNRLGLGTESDGTYTYWDVQSGDGDHALFEALKAQLANPTGDWFADMDPYINTDQYLEFWAWCTVVGNDDGYPFHLNDVIVYENPANGGRLEFFPWGTDESYNTAVYWGYVSGLLSTYCIEDAACVAVLQEKMREALATYETLDIEGMTSAAFALSEQAIQDDPQRARYYSINDVLSYRDLLVQTQAVWPQTVRTNQGL